MVWHFIDMFIVLFPLRLCLVRTERQMGHLVMVVGDGGSSCGYHLTQNLPLASGNSTDTNGLSSVLTEEIASESSSTGDKPLLFAPPVTQLAHAHWVLRHRPVWGRGCTLTFSLKTYFLVHACSAWRLTRGGLGTSNCRDDIGEEGCAKTEWW